MRVLLAIPCLSGGGAEFVAAQWARYLEQMGDQVTVYTTHGTPQDLAPLGVTIVKARAGNFFQQALGLARHLRAEPVDVVVALMPYTNLMSIAAAYSLGSRRPKVVISGHNFANGLRSVRDGSYTRIQWLARRLYRYADLFVAVSHPVGAEAVAEYGLSPNGVVVIPNPALVKLQGRPTKTSSEPTVSNRLDIVVPARLIPQKRPLIALEVAAALSRGFPGEITVHYYGVGPLHDKVVDRATQLDVNAVMHGWVQDWFDECPAGSIVLLASLAEGFGNVLVEAAAAGYKSVVSSRCMGSADAIVPGITGELVPDDSIDDYASAVLTASREGVRDVQPWLQRFSFESSGGTLRQQLSQLVVLKRDLRKGLGA